MSSPAFTPRRRSLPALVVPFCGALLVAAFFVLFEPVETRVRIGYSAAARQDPFLAAQRFLTEMGVPSEPGHSLKQLPPAGHLLVVSTPLAQGEAERLLAWVEEGGYLIAHDDLVLAGRLGVELKDLYEVEDEDEEGQEAAEEEPAPQPEPLEPEQPEPEQPEPGTRLSLGPNLAHEVALGPSIRFVPGDSEPELAATLTGESDPVLVRFRRGKGWVVLFVDLGAFNNQRLGDREHASLLWSLASVDGPPLGARLRAMGYDYPALGALVWRHGWRVVVAGVLLLAFWLWRRAARFGPLLPDPPLERRSLIEHVRAVAQFLWRQGEAGTLVESQRQALLKRAGLRFPGFAKLPSRAKVEKLAALAELPGETVSWALGGAVPRRSPDLVRMIQTLETLRRPL